MAELFPGGHGRLRRVALKPDADGSADGDAEPGAEEGEEEAGAGAPEEFGVEIEVTPAGKSMRRLSLLSGGEKSLVALAFVFAVLMARPCPFYILDEVEAALDDINLDRFLRLVRRFAERSQFVVVTHQKRTMDAADVLYGVSMGDDGITKVVSRKLPAGRRGGARRARRGRRRRGRLGKPGRRRQRRSRLDRPLPGYPAASMDADWREAFDLGDREVAGARATPSGEERAGVFSRLREGLSRSRRALTAELSASFFDRLDEETWERLEEALILADVGAPTTAEVVRRLEDEVESGEVSGARPCASG